MKINASMNIQNQNNMRRMFAGQVSVLNRGVILGGKNVRRDTLSMSGQGQSALVEHLQERKESIKNQREKLIASTLEDGGSRDDIQAVLEMYDDQMRAIDDEISELQKVQNQRLIKQVSTKAKQDAEKDALGRLNDKMARLDSISREVERTELLQDLKAGIDNKIPILESEIERDKGLINHMVERAELSGTNLLTREDLATDNIDSKEELVEELSELSDKLADKIGGRMADHIKDLNEVAKTREKTEDPVEVAEEEEEDTISLTPADEAEEMGETGGSETTDEAGETTGGEDGGASEESSTSEG